jgi:hypothetical protein
VTRERARQRAPRLFTTHRRHRRRTERVWRGVFTRGQANNFFSRGEGALVFRGRGYLVINTVQGKVQIEGFQEVKELPRGVRIKPPLSERLKVYMG